MIVFMEVDIAMKGIGKRLRAARERKGWSQTYVCRRLNISNSRLSGYERDYREPDTEMIKLLADFYDVSTDYLIGSYKTEEIHTIEELLREKNIVDDEGHKLSIYDKEKIIDVVKIILAKEKDTQ